MEFKRLLFTINPKSGAKELNLESIIKSYFQQYSDFHIDCITIDWSQNTQEYIHNHIKKHNYDAVIACGGDGTINFIADIIYGKNITMGILPTGSANALAQNLDIPIDINAALDVIRLGNTQNVSSLMVNNHFCIHLADIGLNAAIVRKFEEIQTRGMLGYLMAFRQIYFKQRRVKATILSNNKKIKARFYMLVFCNGNGFGSGLVINPEGRLDDHKFEIVNIKELSLIEIIRLYLGKKKPSPKFVKITTTQEVEVTLSRRVHLQIDGEYFGKIKNVKAQLNDKFIKFLVP